MKSCVPRLPEITCTVKNFIESAVGDYGVALSPPCSPTSQKEAGALDLGSPETSPSGYDPKCLQDKQHTILRNVQATIG